MAGDTGLFTYEGGFFIKSGNTWKEYRPKDKPGVWATYTQYNEEDNYYNISNNSCTLAIPKKSVNNFYKRENGDWKVVYITRVVYPSFLDSAIGLFCFSTGYYVRDEKHGGSIFLKSQTQYGHLLTNIRKMINSFISRMKEIKCAYLKELT